jgi:ParB family chromosome partitioning protein
MTAKTGRGLGKGLSALIPQGRDEQSDKVIEISVDLIASGESQPRKDFDEEKLKLLADSIAELGVIQPIIVQKRIDGTYSIIAGERRWRAARKAGLKTIPAIVRDLDELTRMQQALIENIVREDLNAIEEAEAIDRLIEEHGMTQEAVGKVLGRSRVAVTNSLRLLKLDSKLKNCVIRGELTAGHARALLGISHEKTRRQTAELVIAKGLNVRQTEALTARIERPEDDLIKGRTKSDVLSDKSGIAVRDLERRLKRTFGTKVSLEDKAGKGKIIVSYNSLDELDRLLELWGVEKS